MRRSHERIPGIQRVYKNHIICEARYDWTFGLEVNKKWFEV